MSSHSPSSVRRVRRRTIRDEEVRRLQAVEEEERRLTALDEEVRRLIMLDEEEREKFSAIEEEERRQEAVDLVQLNLDELFRSVYIHDVDLWAQPKPIVTLRFHIEEFLYDEFLLELLRDSGYPVPKEWYANSQYTTMWGE